MTAANVLPQSTNAPSGLEVARLIAAGDVPVFERLMRQCNRMMFRTARSLRSHSRERAAQTAIP